METNLNSGLICVSSLLKLEFTVHTVPPAFMSTLQDESPICSTIRIDLGEIDPLLGRPQQGIYLSIGP